MEDNSEGIDLILIEDNDYDAELALRVLKKHKLVNNALHFTTAEMALSFLKSSNNMPKIALIDMNLTGMSGVEFLRCLKQQEKTRDIKTAFLTGHVSESDFIDTFILSTSTFIQKPLNASKVLEIVATRSDN
jgi:two-component system, response regulator